jgi:hypothetical protein
MRLDFVPGDSVLLRVYRFDSHVEGEVYSRWLHDQK